MKFIGNLIWIVCGGFVGSILWFLAGILLAVTVIGIPFALQCFKIAGFVLYPFGRDILFGSFGALELLGNIFWIPIFGMELCAAHFLMGLLLCLTVVGVPFGKQHFKLAKISLMPFGTRIYSV